MSLVDKLTPEHRSWLMSQVRARNTSPEIRVRKAAHAMGLRFRLHRNDLPGSPDLVLPRHRRVILVHGCFWHRHSGCRKASIPKTRPDYWKAKFHANVERDDRVTEALERLGWEVSTIWECEVSTPKAAVERLSHIFGSYVTQTKNFNLAVTG